MIVPRKTKWIMDNESIKRCDECTCWKDNNMIAHKWTSRREIKTIFLSEPSQVNKPIPQEWTCPTMIQSWCLSEPRVSIIKIVIMSEPVIKITAKKNKWTLQINKSMAWSEPNDWNNHATGVNLVHRIIIHGKWTWKDETHHWKRSVPECVEQSHFRSEP